MKGIFFSLTLIFGLGILIIGGYVLSTYNSLISQDEAITQQWAQVETQYQRRMDLIPNVVASVKGAMEQEKAVFDAITEARTRYAGATTTDEKVAAVTQVESALARLLVIMENYPDLKSTAVVQDLIVQLEGTENRISVERKRYNDAVGIFNRQIRTIPAKWIADFAGLSARTYFDAADGAATAPKVEL